MGTEGAAARDVPGTTADPNMLPATLGLSWHGEQPDGPDPSLNAPGIPAPAPVQGVHLKHRLCAETPGE